MAAPAPDSAVEAASCSLGCFMLVLGFPVFLLGQFAKWSHLPQALVGAACANLRFHLQPLPRLDCNGTPRRSAGMFS